MELPALPPVVFTLAKIFGSLLAGLAALSLGLTAVPPPRGRARGPHWLSASPGKRAGELLALRLSPLWIASVGAGVRAVPHRGGAAARAQPQPLPRRLTQSFACARVHKASSWRAASTSAGTSGAT